MCALNQSKVPRSIDCVPLANGRDATFRTMKSVFYFMSIIVTALVTSGVSINQFTTDNAVINMESSLTFYHSVRY
jgi:hypothetical protein